MPENLLLTFLTSKSILIRLVRSVHFPARSRPKCGSTHLYGIEVNRSGAEFHFDSSCGKVEKEKERISKKQSPGQI
jgi:hypothetical protein